ncbi:MAG TPA: hypothetical protein VIJ86_00770 [Acidimicrobiales bacterium]
MTGHSIGAEYQGERDSFQIPFFVTSVPLGVEQLNSEAQWAEPDLEAAARAMRQVMREPVLAASKARSAQERERRHLSPPHAVRQMKHRLADIDELRRAVAVESGGQTPERSAQ